MCRLVVLSRLHCVKFMYTSVADPEMGEGPYCTVRNSFPRAKKMSMSKSLIKIELNRRLPPPLNRQLTQSHGSRVVCLLKYIV